MVLKAGKIKDVIKGLFLLLIIGLMPHGLYSQEIEDLRSERLKQMEEIEYTEKLLQQTSASKQSKLNELNLLNRRIKSREKVVSSLRGELNYLDRSIKNNRKEIDILSKEIKGLKDDYANMIYRAYLTKNSYHKVQYILAASDFNQAYKRLKYLQQYSQFRREQAEVIKNKSQQLQDEISKLESSIEQQKKLLVERQVEVAQLNNEKQQQRNYVEQLGNKEKQLRKDLNDKKKVYDRIESEINKLLKAAMGESSGGMIMTPEMKIVSDNFLQNKGRLPWPVERGLITEKFGKHKHPVLSKVIVDNPGVNMTTEKGEEIRSVFKGTVKNVFKVPGANFAIIIQHGEYFSVYQGLVDVRVKKGDEVALKQVLGRAFAGPDDSNSQLHFEVYKGIQKLDPELWLAK